MSKLSSANYEPLIGQSAEDLENFFLSLGHRAFRGKQIFDWIYRKNIFEYHKMTDLSSDIRKKLIDVPIHPLKMIESDISGAKQTQKFLFELKNGKKVESVIMREKERITVCLSTQVGCAVDCDFCATAKMGFYQNLSTGEIIDQFIQLKKIIGKEISNVVFMGMGEPFLNYKNCMQAAHLLHDPKGVNLGAWRITISTAGVVNKIGRFTKEKQPFKLAVSLNAVSQEQRERIMPMTKKMKLLDLIKVSKEYTIISKKKITFEYVLLAGINDSQEDALNLKKILSSINCKLNLIPYNEIEGGYSRSSEKKIVNFFEVLKNARFPVTIRWSKGQDIDAGCGQLATDN